MCGVVGYFPIQPGEHTNARFRALMMESRIRGTHAYGIAQPELTKSHEISEVCDVFDHARPAIAHCRYSTSGDWHDHRNNQPIVCDDVALVFNGVIDMGTRPEMEERWSTELETDNDGELFARCVASGGDLIEFVRVIEGSFAGLWLRNGRLHAIRNERRPLWRCIDVDAVWYASTEDIMVRAGLPRWRCEQVEPHRLEVW